MENKHKKTMIVLFIIVLVLGLTILLYYTKDTRHLQKYGFSASEREAILKLNEQEQTYFLNHKDLWDIFDQSDYQKENLTRYIALHKNPFTLNLDTIIKYVNKNYDTLGINITSSTVAFLDHPEFQAEKAKQYVTYRKENPKVATDAIIKIVNANIDTLLPIYDEAILLLLGEPYFIKENTTRYLEYQQKYHTNAKETIEAVNVNLDYAYYTNSLPADTSLENLILVNKYYILDKDFVPTDLITTDPKYNNRGLTFQLKKEAYDAFVKMESDIEKEGMKLKLNSLYRSYNTQKNLYQNYVNRDGIEAADTYSARPGYSEHQTGLAIDMTTFDTDFNSFEETKAYAWLQENAHKYGFILRYPEGKEAITGYTYESWHYRYLGVETATKVKESGLTYDEYFAYYIRKKQD